MKISLIGMSGSGKSFWSKKLQQAGFTRYSIDFLLEKKLEVGLKQLGYSGLNDLAKWMRQPYEDRYKRTSKIYLDYEKKTMMEVLSLVETMADDEDVVVDTTGSVIYMEDLILNKLTTTTRVIYLETPIAIQQEMFMLYLKDPKPVIWGDSFNKKLNESNHDALARCYPELLSYRTKRYENLAHKTLPYDTLRKKSFSIDTFTAAIS